MNEYFHKLDETVNNVYRIAENARKQGPDPKPEVEIPLATTMAERVEGLVGPEGVAKKIEELAVKGYSSLLIAIKIAQDIIMERYDGISLPENIAEQGIRTGIAIITNGVVSAPLEGIASVRIQKEGHLAISFASPIRGAGGTAQAMSVVLAELIRKHLNLVKYRPNKAAIERYVEEINLYENIKNLQYPVSDEGIRIAVRNLTVQIDGEPTEKQEVTANRDIPEVLTNRVRGGMCLVLNDGVVGRWNKTLKTIDELKLTGWDWLKQVSKASKHPIDEESLEEVSIDSDPDEEKYVDPEFKFVSDVIGGRPIFSHPSQKGGFRLRYGRSRNTGLAAVGVNPASMTILRFLAPGTHIVTERPGKGSIVTPISTIEGPLVLLEDGSVLRVNTVKEAKKLIAHDLVKEIIELGDILVSFGEFVENNKDLLPSGYVEEWWAQDVKKSLSKNPIPLEEDSDSSLPAFTHLKEMINSPLHYYPTVKQAIAISIAMDVPLHPKFTPHWYELTLEEIWDLRKIVKENVKGLLSTESFFFNYNENFKNYLETLGVPHKLENNTIQIEDFWLAIYYGLILDKEIDINQIANLELFNKSRTIIIRRKAPIRVGARLGRPEKAKERKMKPPVHVLYPIGNSGGPQRNLVKTYRQRRKFLEVQIQHRNCPKCGYKSHSRICPKCSAETKEYYICRGPDPHISENELCETCSLPCNLYSLQEVDFVSEFATASKKVGGSLDIVKGVKLLMSKARTPEPIEKGILRARHKIYTFKDGTCRFDMTNAPLTHFKPREIGVSTRKLNQLGYEHDIRGEFLESDNQVVEIYPQDIIVNIKALKYLFRVSKFIDEELQLIYGREPYYCVKTPNDLIGTFVIGLAPHTSAGIIGRIIGSVTAELCYAHPWWHAAKRRNCFTYDQEIIIWDKIEKRVIVQSIGKIIEDLIKNGAAQQVVDDFGTIVVKNNFPNWQVISINPKTLIPIYQSIKHWIKGLSTVWLQISTKTGRTFTVTPDHQMLIWNASKQQLLRKRASELKLTDQVPVFTELTFPEIHAPYEVNILQEFSEKLPNTEKFQEFKQQVRLRYAKEWIKEKLRIFIKNKLILPDFKDLRQYSNHFKLYFKSKIPKKPYKHIMDPDWFKSIPLNHLEVLQKEGVFKWNEIPKNTSLGMARSDLEVKPYLIIGEDFARILGYFISEGHIRDKYGTNQLNIAVTNPFLKEHIETLLENLFELKPSHIGVELILSSKIHSYLFAYAWNTGSRALNKRIPNFVYTWPKQLRLHLISTLIDGDGSILENPPRITLYTANRELAMDYCTLLCSIGLFTSFHKAKGGRYGKAVLEKYERLGKKPKENNPLYHVVLNKSTITRNLDYQFLQHPEKRDKFLKIADVAPPQRDVYRKLGEKMLLDPIKSIEPKQTEEPSYCLEVSCKTKDQTFHNLTLHGINLVISQCDSDEDAIFLLMDALLNFSRAFLPATRGGLMDAPLVLSSHLEPKEVDPEAFNVDTSWSFPLEFFLTTWQRPSRAAKEIDYLLQAQARLGTPLQYEGFGFTHSTDDIAAGPEVTLYKQLDTMVEKVNEQMAIAKKIRAVDENDVAKRVLDSHFFRDMAGTLRAYACQTFRCLKCNRKYRRIPLQGQCRCGGKITLTVYPESTKKYLSIAQNLDFEYKIPEFARSRIKLLELVQDQMFGGDEKQKQLDGFFGRKFDDLEMQKDQSRT